MRYSDEQIKELAAQLDTEVRQFEEAGDVFLYIPGLKMPPGCTPEKSDALLCPQQHSGYSSRLFFKERIQSPKAVNWNGQVFALGYQWYAFSYNNVPVMRPFDMVINHLRGMVG